MEFTGPTSWAPRVGESRSPALLAWRQGTAFRGQGTWGCDVALLGSGSCWSCLRGEGLTEGEETPSQPRHVRLPWEVCVAWARHGGGEHLYAPVLGCTNLCGPGVPVPQGLCTGCRCCLKPSEVLWILLTHQLCFLECQLTWEGNVCLLLCHCSLGLCRTHSRCSASHCGVDKGALEHAVCVCACVYKLCCHVLWVCPCVIE